MYVSDNTYSLYRIDNYQPDKLHLHACKVKHGNLKIICGAVKCGKTLRLFASAECANLYVDIEYVRPLGMAEC